MLLHCLTIVLLVPGELLAEERQEGIPRREEPLPRYHRHLDLRTSRQQRPLTTRSTTATAGNSYVKETCQLETFEPVCSHENVMLIEKADYGRMTVGRCINRNYYIGCSANVLEQVHKRCSLRRTCKISVPDHSLLRNSACPKDLVAFLSVKYACIKVLDTLTFQCSHKGQALLNLEPVIYITDRDLNHIRASGISCKIVISAKPGQFIRVTLHEMWSRDAGSSSHWLRTRKRRRPSSTEDNLEHLIGHDQVGHRQQPIRNNGIRAGRQRQLNTSGNNSTMSTVTKSLTSPTSTTSAHSVATRRRATHTTVEHKMKRSNHIASPPESQVNVQQCIPVALIAETSNPDQKHPVCPGGSRLPHATVVYTSSGNSLQLIPSLDDLLLTTGSDDSMREENLREAIGEGDDDDNDDDDDGDRDQVKRYGDFLMSFQACSCPDLELTLGMSFKVIRKGDQADVVCPSSQEIWSLSCVNDTWIGELGRCDEGGWFVATVCIALGGVLSVGLIGVVISQRRRNCYKLFPPKSSSLSSSSSSAHHLKQQKHQRKSGQGSINRGDLIHCNLIGCPLDQSRVEPDHGSDLHLCTDPLFCTNDSLFCHPDPVFCDPRRPHEAEVKFCEDCQKRLTEQNVNKLSPSCRVCRFSFDASTTE